LKTFNQILLINLHKSTKKTVPEIVNDSIREWLEQKRREIGDNDEWRAIDLIKDLLEEFKTDNRGVKST
jgi:hypothetical protein